jgi:hypothetical protein
MAMVTASIVTAAWITMVVVIRRSPKPGSVIKSRPERFMPVTMAVVRIKFVQIVFEMMQNRFHRLHNAAGLPHGSVEVLGADSVTSDVRDDSIGMMNLVVKFDHIVTKVFDAFALMGKLVNMLGQFFNFLRMPPRFFQQPLSDH